MSKVGFGWVDDAESAWHEHSFSLVCFPHTGDSLPVSSTPPCQDDSLTLGGALYLAYSLARASVFNLNILSHGSLLNDDTLNFIVVRSV